MTSPLKQFWRTHRNQIICDGPVQHSKQCPPDGPTQLTSHPTTALIAHLGTEELALHIATLHNQHLLTQPRE